MWSYSSRGPGELAGSSGMSEKPDVTAPTPENGAVLYGDSVQVLANGWGTSGAAPQAAGLAALLLSHRPHSSTSDVFDVIRGTAVALGHARECEGSGMIDCKAALDA
jgi:serine protease AprX